METDVATTGLAALGGFAGLLMLVAKIAEVVGKAIPDTATGFLGTVRKVTKFIGMYVKNNNS